MSTITLFGKVGTDFTSKGVTDQLENATEDVTVQLNSGGGSFFEGLAIYHVLERHGVIVGIMSAALASGAIIAMAGRKIRMARGSLLMIHSPFSLSGGTVREHRADIEMLQRAERSSIDIFSARTQLSRQKIAEMMEAETWLDTTEAIELGFADELIESTVGVTASFSSWNAVVDYMHSELQRNERLRVTRRQAMIAAQQRYPQLHQRYLADANRKAPSR